MGIERLLPRCHGLRALAVLAVTLRAVGGAVFSPALAEVKPAGSVGRGETGRLVRD